MDNKKREQLIKQLLYQSCNRGCKETDLIIGEFAKQNLETMSDKELDIFLDLLNLADADIYDWYTKKRPVPKKNISEVMSNLLNFVPIDK
jgi:antitoxin CptB